MIRGLAAATVGSGIASRIVRRFGRDLERVVFPLFTTIGRTAHINVAVAAPCDASLRTDFPDDPLLCAFCSLHAQLRYCVRATRKRRVLQRNGVDAGAVASSPQATASSRRRAVSSLLTKQPRAAPHATECNEPGLCRVGRA